MNQKPEDQIEDKLLFQLGDKLDQESVATYSHEAAWNYASIKKDKSN